jgi:hypothetical protein
MNEIEKAEFEKWWMTTFHGLSTDETIRYRDVGKQSAMIGWAAAIKHERDRSNDIVQAKLSCAKELSDKDKEIESLKIIISYFKNVLIPTNKPSIIRVKEPINEHHVENLKSAFSLIDEKDKQILNRNKTIEFLIRVVRGESAIDSGALLKIEDEYLNNGGQG